MEIRTSGGSNSRNEDREAAAAQHAEVVNPFLSISTMNIFGQGKEEGHACRRCMHAYTALRPEYYGQEVLAARGVHSTQPWGMF